jgi:uncharacterized membrane protein
LILLILSHINIIKDKNIIYFVCAILGLLIAIYFSISQIKDVQDCPSPFGIPLCYLSFIMFTLLIVLKFFETGERK